MRSPSFRRYAFTYIPTSTTVIFLLSLHDALPICSFDVYTGKLQRAPQFWIDNNMEWAYRLIKQPKRIVRQVFLVKFLYLLARGKVWGGGWPLHIVKYRYDKL